MILIGICFFLQYICQTYFEHSNSTANLWTKPVMLEPLVNFSLVFYAPCMPILFWTLFVSFVKYLLWYCHKRYCSNDYRHYSIYVAVVMVQPLQEFTQFIWVYNSARQLTTFEPLNEASQFEPLVHLNRQL